MLFSVDFQQRDSFAVELSFTLLDWIILERIVDDRTYDFSSVGQEEQIQLTFNIFPRLKTVFHILAVNPHVCDFKVIQSIFTLAEKEDKNFGGGKITLPILPDEKGATPLDLCLSEGSQKNIKLAALLFQNTKDYPFLHSSIFLRNAVNQAIRYNVPTIGEFLDKRF